MPEECKKVKSNKTTWKKHEISKPLITFTELQFETSSLDKNFGKTSKTTLLRNNT